MLRSVIDQFRLARDHLRRRLAMWVWDRPTKSVGPFVDRVVFVRWDAKLGDTVVLSWVLRELQRQRPDLELTVITGPEFENLFRHGYGIQSIYLAGRRNGWRELKRIAKSLHKPRYVVHLGAIWRPRDLFFVNKLQAEHVVGLDDGLSMIDIKLGERTRGWHFSDKLAPWLDEMGVDTSNRQYWVPRSDEQKKKVMQWWPAQSDVIGFCPFGASRKRHLPIEIIKRIIRAVLDKPATRILMLAPPYLAAELQKSLVHESWFDRLIFAPTNHVLELFEQVAHCKAMISVDTALVHIASGLALPLVALYAAQSPDSDNMLCWYPKASQAISLIAKNEQPDLMGEFDAVQLKGAIDQVLGT
ncbi:MAG: hypothetical protein LRY56_12050 [Burkholderiaceae bacterium]|nr:hypothetical protein [Burkholderiaceae bacterium]